MKEPTKKMQKAATVAENKQLAFIKKVRRLIAHVAERTSTEVIVRGMSAGLTAEEVAAAIASREPVGRAVHPLKEVAVKRAHDRVVADIADVRASLEAVGWDRTKIAPYAYARRHDAYEQHKAAVKFERFDRYTVAAANEHGRWDEKEKPYFVTMDDDRCERTIAATESDAANEYDAFIIKLVDKIGECETAALTGSHVWGESLLTVTKAGGVVEYWRTHQIENRSKLGLWFPQWPSRKVKA